MFCFRPAHPQHSDEVCRCVDKVFTIVRARRLLAFSLMASNAVLTFGPSRPKHITYGKAAPKPGARLRDHDFTAFDSHAPSESPSKLQKLSNKSLFLAKPVSPSEATDAVFDVPSSDDGKDNAGSPESPHSQINAQKRKRKRKLGKTNPLLLRPKHPHELRNEVSHAFKDSRKRKRADLGKINSRQSPVLSDIERQVNDQIHRETTNTYVSESSTINGRIAIQRYFKQPASIPIDKSHALSASRSASEAVTLIEPRSSGQCSSPSASSFSETFDSKSALPSPSQQSTPPHSPNHGSEIRTAIRCDTPKTSQQSSFARSLSNTPKQRRLWDDLLKNESQPTLMNGAKSPHYGNSKRRTEDSEGWSYNQHPRRRLIDTLRPLKSTHSADESANSDIKSTQQCYAMDHNARSELQDVTMGANSSQQAIISRAGPRITYSEQRSFLEEGGDESHGLLASTLSEDSREPGEAARKGVIPNQEFDLSPEVIAVDENNDGTIQTIHELRASGDTRRFNDEIDRLLVDLVQDNKAVLSRKRSAIIELANSLRDDSFKDRFIQSSYMRQVFRLCKSEKDPIAGSAVAAAVVEILDHPQYTNASTILNREEVWNTLSNILQIRRDLNLLARDRQLNMSKYAQGTVRDFCNQVQKSKAWASHDLKFLDPQIIALKAIELLVRRTREYGDFKLLPDREMVLFMLELSSKTAQALEHSKDKNASGIWFRLETTVSIFESCSLADVFTTDKAIWSQSRLSQVVDLADSILSITTSHDFSIRQLLLRFCVTFTNNNAASAMPFARVDFLKKMTRVVVDGFESLLITRDEESDQAALDQLILALGALFNLSEVNDSIGKIIAEKCSRALDRMLCVFNGRRAAVTEAESIEATRGNIALGYLAVLLGSLCQSEVACNAIRSKLVGATLSPLIDAIEEFTRHHREVDKGAASNEVWAGFTTRLETVAEKLKNQEEESRGS